MPDKEQIFFDGTDLNDLHGDVVEGEEYSQSDEAEEGKQGPETEDIQEEQKVEPDQEKQADHEEQETGTEESDQRSQEQEKPSEFEIHFDEEKVNNFIENFRGDPKALAKEAIRQQKLATYRQNVVNYNSELVDSLTKQKNELEAKINEFSKSQEPEQSPAESIDQNKIKNVVESIRDSDDDNAAINALTELTREISKNTIEAQKSIFEQQKSQQQEQISSDKVTEHNAFKLLDIAKKITLNEARLAGDIDTYTRLSEKDSQITGDDWAAAMPKVHLLQNKVLDGLAATNDGLLTDDHVDLAMKWMETKNLVEPTKQDYLASQPTRKIMQPNGRPSPRSPLTSAKEIEGMDRYEAREFADKLTKEQKDKVLAELGYEFNL